MLSPVHPVKSERACLTNDRRVKDATICKSLVVSRAEHGPYLWREEQVSESAIGRSGGGALPPAPPGWTGAARAPTSSAARARPGPLSAVSGGKERLERAGKSV